MELGLYTFAERTPDPHTGRSVSAAERLNDVIEEAELADQLGLDVFGVGEHHRPEFVVSAPTVVLAAIAARTKRIKLTSAVTVLSSDDPVRVYEQFATLDLLSGGRAEIMAGRGSFIESFPLFGYNLDDYDDLFAEKLDLLAGPAPERADHLVGRAPPAARRPRSLPPARAADPGLDRRGRDTLPRWCGRARWGCRWRLRSSAGCPSGSRPWPSCTGERRRRPATPKLELSINSHGFISDTPEEAIDDSFASVASVMDKIGRERGWPPMTREQYEASATLRGANFLGNPAQVTDKILFQHEIFGHDRFMLQLTVGSMPHDKVMHAIELYATEVAPAVRAELARRGYSPAEAPT